MKCPCNTYIEKQHKNDPKFIIRRHRKHKKYGKETQNNHKTHKKKMHKATKQRVVKKTKTNEKSCKIITRMESILKNE